MADLGKKKAGLLGVGIGAGLLGGLAVVLRAATRPAKTTVLPGEIAPERFQTRVVDTRSGQIVYHEGGSGRSVVLLHSVCVGGSSYEWSKVALILSTAHRVLVPDLLGFGESERSPVPLAMSEHADALADLVDHTCGREPVVLCGSGAGAAIAVLVALRHPELVSRLCLSISADGAGSIGPRFAWIRHLLASTPVVNRFAYRNFFATEKRIRQWLEDFAFYNPDAVTSECVRVFTACAQQFGAEHAAFAMLRGKLYLDLERSLRQVNVPVRLLWGDSGSFPKADPARHLNALPVVSAASILEGTGFLRALEAPDRVAEVLMEELRSGIRLVSSG